MLGAVEEERPAPILDSRTERFVRREYRRLTDIKGSLPALSQLLHIEGDGGGCPLLGPYVHLVHTGIAVVCLHIGIGKFGSLLPHLHVPDGRHVSVLLGVADGDADVTGFCLSAVYHG